MAASGKRNFNDCFPALDLNSELTCPDPMPTFGTSRAEWLVTKCSSRSRRLLTDKSSAKAASGLRKKYDRF